MFNQPIFWLSLLGLGALGTLLGVSREKALGWSITLTSVGILYFIAGISVWSLIMLVAIATVVGWSAVRSYNPWLIFTPVLGLWIMGKLGDALPTTGLGWIVFTGFSFALVKIWTLLRDINANQVQDVNCVTILAYLFHFPTFISGPMYYFREFQETLQHPQWPDGAEWVDVVFRILFGYLKVMFLAPLIEPLSLVAFTDAHTVTVGQLLAASILYYCVIYLNFSGYSDMAIGATRMMGLHAPENFNYPYLAVNIRDFWQRWHMTFSRVLTSYIFVPFSRALTSRTGLSRIPIMALSYIGTFLLCGFWHGSTPNFLLWGLYHAGGLILLDLYHPWIVKGRITTKAATPAWRRVAVRGIAVMITFLFVSVGWIPFVLPIDTMIRLAAHLVS